MSDELKAQELEIVIRKRYTPNPDSYSRVAVDDDFDRPMTLEEMAAYDLEQYEAGESGVEDLLDISHSEVKVEINVVDVELDGDTEFSDPGFAHTPDFGVSHEHEQHLGHERAEDSENREHVVRNETRSMILMPLNDHSELY